jgi:hypothetical protein
MVTEEETPSGPCWTGPCWTPFLDSLVIRAVVGVRTKWSRDWHSYFVLTHLKFESRATENYPEFLRGFTPSLYANMLGYHTASPASCTVSQSTTRNCPNMRLCKLM